MDSVSFADDDSEDFGWTFKTARYYPYIELITITSSNKKKIGLFTEYMTLTDLYDLRAVYYRRTFIDCPRLSLETPDFSPINHPQFFSFHRLLRHHASNI